MIGVVNINVYAKFYPNIPNGLELSTVFTNRPGTKSSQTLYESQPSVSVDFLRVVQLPVLSSPITITLSILDCRLKLPSTDCSGGTKYMNGTCYSGGHFSGLWNETLFTQETVRKRVLPSEEYWK